MSALTISGTAGNRSDSTLDWPIRLTPPLHDGIGKSAGIIVNYYNDAGRAALEDGIIPHFNEKCTRYFEASIQQKCWELGEHKQYDYFGVVSWKMQQKTMRSPAQLKRVIRDDTDSPDFYWAKLYGLPEKTHPWMQGELSHPGLITVARVVLQTAGIHPMILMPETDAVWCQTYAARRDIFDAFMRECMIPCMEVMELPELQPMLMQDGHYQSPGVTPQRMAEIFGVPHYTLHPFIIERLFPSYAAAKGWRGKLI